MALLDTKTGKRWPLDVANLRLQEIREGCRDDLRARDEGRGIVDGKLTTTIPDKNEEGKTKEVVDVVKQHQAHTGDEFNKLLEARWREYCSKPRDLDAFVATLRTPEKEAVQKAKDAAAGIEESLHEEPKAQVPDFAPSPPEPPKRGPGRPKKAVAVEA